MHHRKRSGTSEADPGNLVFWPSSRRPARVLIVEASPPWWSDSGEVLCDALDDFLTLASSLDGPCRIPLLSLYAISRRQECLLPFAVRGNLARLRTCVEELRSISGEGCIREATRAGELLQQAVLDALQQFRQYMSHRSTSGHGTFLEVTVMTSQSGCGVVRHLETALRDADLVSLRRLLVVQILTDADWAQDSSSPEAMPAETEADCLMCGPEVDLQRVGNSVLDIEMVLKAWLQEQGGDGEQLHLLLPRDAAAVCIKCDVQQRVISPALVHLSPGLGVTADSVRDFGPVGQGSANQRRIPPRLKAIKALRADGVCESLLFGLPLVLHPTACWQLDWDEMEANNKLFHALCHTLQNHDWYLLLQMEPARGAPASSSGVCSHYVLQPSSALSLLLKPVTSRELLLPCSLPPPAPSPAPDATHTVQACLAQLDEEFVFNPLCLSSKLYQHLRRGLQSQPGYPYRPQAAAPGRDPLRPPEGAKGPGFRLPRQPQSRHQGAAARARARATVAPFPPSHGPPPPKASRPALTLLGRGRAPVMQEGDDKDDVSTATQGGSDD